MFNHVMVGASDLDRAKTFYDAVLGTLGFSGEAIRSVAPSGHVRLFYMHNGNTFGVSEPINGEPASFGNGATVGFKCESPEQVRAFHDAGVAAGGTSVEDPPGLRNGAMGPMHLSYLRDPDGNKLCAIHRPK